MVKITYTKDATTLNGVTCVRFYKDAKIIHKVRYLDPVTKADLKDVCKGLASGKIFPNLQPL